MVPDKLPEKLSWVEKFYRYSGNPILRPQGKGYAADLIFNPGAVLYDDTVMMLCRGVDFSRQPKSRENWGISSFGWALFSLDNPAELIARSSEPFLKPEKLYELFGMSNFTIFSQGLVQLNGKYILYYACNDTRIACAVSET